MLGTQRVHIQTRPKLGFGLLDAIGQLDRSDVVDPAEVPGDEEAVPHVVLRWLFNGLDKGSED